MGRDGVETPGSATPTIRSMGWEGDDYQRRFDTLAAQGRNVHGEADFVSRLAPAVGARRRVRHRPGGHRAGPPRGATVVGVDNDASMLATARSRGPGVEWIQADVTALDLGRVFDVVVMAGNVPLFTPPGTQAALVAGGARARRARRGASSSGSSSVVATSSTEFDEHCADAGLSLDGRFATWDRDPFPGDGSYAVSVLRRTA